MKRTLQMIFLSLIISLGLNTPIHAMTGLSQEEILEEMKYGDMELVAQLVQAEAGNQDLTGKRLVADVVYNRVRDPRFPNTVEGVV